MKMTSLLKKYSLILLAVCCFAAAAVLENDLLQKHPEKRLIAGFQRKLIEKESRLDNYLEEITRLTSEPGFAESYLSVLAPYNFLLENRGFGFLVYRNNKLIYWSDRAIAFSDNLPFSNEELGPLIHFPNGYYLIHQKEANGFLLVGLVLVKYDYSHENQYLHNAFYDDFSLPDSYRLLKATAEKGYPVKNLHGETVFAVAPAGEYFCLRTQLYFPAIIYFAGLILMLFGLRRLISGLEQSLGVKLMVTGAALFLIYWLHILFHIPKVFSYLDFFSPSYFAVSYWLPSLGDFFLFAVFSFFFMLNLYWDFRFLLLENNSGVHRKYLAVMLIFLSGLSFLAVNHFIRVLIYNSSFSYTLNRINEITLQTIIGMTSIMLLLLGVILFSIRVAGELRRFFAPREIFVMGVAVTLFLVAIQVLLFPAPALPVILFFLLIMLLSVVFSRKTSRKFGMSYLILYVAILTIYSLESIYRITVVKEREVQKLMATNLVAEHDPAAEVFLTEIQAQIRLDSNIPHYLILPSENLEQYLERTYFSGFFRQYDLQITICTGSDSVRVQPDNVTEPCFPFFDEMIKNQGFPVPGTNFYYMDNMNGRISYFGRLHYPLSSDSLGVSVFIELNSKILSEGIGFPELLIDRSMRKPESYKRFDYAKYYGGELVNRHGSYPYNYYIYSYNFKDAEFDYNTWDGYEHLIHHTRQDNYVIVSRSLYTIIDYLISFPYLFVFYFVFSLIALFLIQPSFRKRKILFDLKFRIQAAIISIVFVSLLVVALGTILYNVEEYRSRHREDLDEKMNAISEEIDMRLEDVETITPELKDWMALELVKLSNIFKTDINIYGVEGKLLVSSRPEVFAKGLVSDKISMPAYFELFENFQTNYFQPEKIGNLNYLSAYEPIINNRGEYLGFINLPYFTRQDKYNQEISTFIVAFINLYVLLFLASLLVAVFISNQITRPLVVIRENLRKIELGKRNEPINYGRNDEIGNLVKEYNKKVDELSVSAELLARSERETAWREMAKQVAHEIKNPLTPMKLNIQHLQRFKGTEKEYQAYIDRVARTLIEQIDTLSEIATEFSNFAQIPTARRQVFNLSVQISKVIELFENHDKVQIEFKASRCKELEVFADREQLSRALINLIKNGIQAIPEGKAGKITITLSKKDYLAVIAVADNGSGIPAELQEKMFSPSFTTKSSGMGLGLAIVKNIVENFRGRVWYETELNKGSVFYLEIPIYEHSASDENNCAE